MSAGALFVGFARVGLFGFGGGPSMIPLMQQECIAAGFVTEQQFLEGLAVGNALPGPIASKMAVYVGWLDSGLPGALGALAGVILPSVVLMGLLTGVVLRYREHPVMVGALKGVKPAVIGMLAFVAWDLAPAGIVGVTSAAVAAIAFAALVMRIHPAAVLLAALAFGAMFFRV